MKTKGFHQHQGWSPLFLALRAKIEINR